MKKIVKETSGLKERERKFPPWIRPKINISFWSWEKERAKTDKRKEKRKEEEEEKEEEKKRRKKEKKREYHRYETTKFEYGI